MRYRPPPRLASAAALAVLPGLAACSQRGSSLRDAGGDSWPIDSVPYAASEVWQADMPAPGDLGDSGAADTASQPAGPGAVDAEVAADASPGEVTCTRVCNAATPVYPTVFLDGGQGNITMYTTEPSTGGACNYGATSVRYFAAVNVNVDPGDGRGQWQGGHICGQCAEVTALTSQGPQSVVVRIMDKCPDGYCGMDLGGAAPAAVMRDGFGRYDGYWRLVSCAGHPEVYDGSTSLFVVAGANAYWSRVQIRNPPGAVDGIAWSDPQGGNGFFAYATDPENTFEVPAEVLQSLSESVTITARFNDGSTATTAVNPAQLAAGNSSYPLQ